MKGTSALCGAREKNPYCGAGGQMSQLDHLPKKLHRGKSPCGDPENNKVAIGENQYLTVNCRATAGWRSTILRWGGPQIHHHFPTGRTPPSVLPHHPPQHTHIWDKQAQHIEYKSGGRRGNTLHSLQLKRTIFTLLRSQVWADCWDFEEFLRNHWINVAFAPQSNHKWLYHLLSILYYLPYALVYAS